jgi:hypothetical protein
VDSTLFYDDIYLPKKPENILRASMNKRRHQHLIRSTKRLVMLFSDTDTIFPCKREDNREEMSHDGELLEKKNEKELHKWKCKRFLK